MTTVVQSADGPQRSKCSGRHLAESDWRLARMPSLVVLTIRTWMWRLQQRRELATMTDLELQDIGMTPCNRSWLVNKPFWKE